MYFPPGCSRTLLRVRQEVGIESHRVILYFTLFNTYIPRLSDVLSASTEAYSHEP